MTPTTAYIAQPIPLVPGFPSFSKSPNRYRLSAVLLSMVLFAMAFSVKALASPPGRSWAPYTVTITIIKDYALANNKEKDIILVNVMDGGVPADVDVTFLINGGSGVNPTGHTDASGNITQNLISGTPGPGQVQIMIDGVLYPATPITVHFVASAGPPDPTQALTVLIVDVVSTTADGVSTDKVHAHVVDANQNPVAGATVNFSAVGGSAAGTAVLVPVSGGVTDANGDAVLYIKNTKVGTVDISAKIGGTDINNSPATVIFVVGPPDLGSSGQSYIAPNRSGATADNSDQNSVVAHVADAGGNPLPAGTVVTFAIASGTANFVGGVVTAVTNAAGDAIIYLTSSVAGDVTLTAQVNGTDILNGSPAKVTFVAGAPNGGTNGNSFIKPNHSGATADNVDQNSVLAHVADANGNPLPAGTVVTFAIASGTANFVGGIATAVVNASGDAIIYLTSVVAGDVRVTAQVGGVDILNGSPAIVTFVAGAPDGSGSGQSYIAANRSGAVADNADQNSVLAHVADVNGNPLPAGTVVTFTIASGTANFVGGTATATVNAAGDAIIYLISSVAGEVTLTATVGGVSILNGSPAKVIFVIGPPDGSANGNSYIKPNHSGATANNIDQNSVLAHIVDANGNIFPQGTVVTFAIASGTADFVGGVATATTDFNGDAIIFLTSTVAGDVTLTAQSGGVNILNGSPAKVTFVAGAPDPSKSTLIVIKNNALADDSHQNVVQAHIVDAYNNPITNQTVTVSFEISGGSVAGTTHVVGSATVTTDASGNANIALTNPEAGTADIKAQINSTYIANGNSVTVTFTNAPDVTNPATELTVVVFEALADGQSTTSVKAHVVDQNGNPLPDQTIVFTIDSGKADILTAQPVITDANGDAIIQLSSLTAGDVLITATVNGEPIVNGSPARVRFAAINIYVPKVFTPNGDGTNDVLKPILVGIAEFHYFNIYNRWGNLIYSSKDPGAGWDGRFKGVYQPVETYLWIAEGIDIRGKKIVQKGMVSLVR